VDFVMEHLTPVLTFQIVSNKKGVPQEKPVVVQPDLATTFQNNSLVLIKQDAFGINPVAVLLQAVIVYTLPTLVIAKMGAPGVHIPPLVQELQPPVTLLVNSIVDTRMDVMIIAHVLDMLQVAARSPPLAAPIKQGVTQKLAVQATPHPVLSLINLIVVRLKLVAFGTLNPKTFTNPQHLIFLINS
jgi:hypothetical protein